MCGGCGKIPDAVMTDVSASCWRSNVSFSQARSSIGILPILENVLFENVLFVSLCRRMHSRIAWYVSEVNSVYQGLFQSVVVVHLKYMAAIVEAVVLSVVIISACRLGWRDSHALLVRERVCCLLVLNLVSSTLSCIRQPRPRLLVLDVCGFV
jgi:hypothetical protein